MSEDQLKAAQIEATAQVEVNVEEISEEDLEAVAGGLVSKIQPDIPFVGADSTGKVG